MTSLAAGILLLMGPALGQTPQAPSLNLEKDAFVFRSPGKQPVVEPLKLDSPRDPERVVYRRNDSFAVWDERGLSVRFNGRTKSWKLVDVALTPKLFTREQIVKTKSLIERGVRQKEASALSGSKRIGGAVYFLVRWTETTGVTWLEALIKVDLESAAPTPKLLGKFAGFTLSTKRVDDKLFPLGGALCAITRTASEWYLAKFDPTGEQFEAAAEGLKLESYSTLGRGMGVFVEKTETGSRLVGRVDLSTGSRRNLLETRLPVSMLDHKRPSVAILKGGTLHNLESGVETPLPAGATVRRTDAGVLVWWPSGEPTRAVLLNPERWLPLAKWQKGVAAPAPKPAKKKSVAPTTPKPNGNKKG